MISVAEALDHLFALVSPLEPETVPLRAAAGRILATPVAAKLTQPPFAASAMDGYAVRATEVEQDAQFKVIGEAAAGHGYSGRVGPGQAVRIFTGAPLPEGTDCVVIQEDVTRRGDLIAITAERIDTGHVRPAGGDFKKGDNFAPAGPLAPGDIALLASMNHGMLSVRRRPVVALIPTGDELVQPGEDPGPAPDHRVEHLWSRRAAGAERRRGARAAGSEGHGRQPAHGLRSCAGRRPDRHDRRRVGGRSRPGRARSRRSSGWSARSTRSRCGPANRLMAGRLHGTPMVGLPGNPVSAMVCGTVFLLPMMRVMLGQAAEPSPAQDGGAGA